MQYLSTGWFGILIVLSIAAFILVNIARSKRGKDLFIRRISGLNAIEEAVGRATEMGRPVLMVPGLGDLNANSMQALNIFAHVTKMAARFATPIRVCCAVPPVFTVAQEIVRDVYQREGMMDRYDPDSVRFLSDRQFAFAAAVSGIINREKTAATFFLGEFFAESLIFAESANAIGAIQIAGSTQNTQTPFFIAACDYVLIADEFYAASAYLTREPVLVGSLIGQDWGKLTLMAMIIIGAFVNTAQLNTTIQYKVTPDYTRVTDDAHKMRKGETTVKMLFNPATIVKGQPVSGEKKYASIEDYARLRATEIPGATTPVAGGEDAVADVTGVWHSWTVSEGVYTRVYEDLVVTDAETGEVSVIREYKSRLQEIPEPAPAEAAGGAN
ncbi:MAG: hypothetical protein KF784_08605 [Fimbriimonadaceae bacterium]|nr:hypothetical protein [Fimbriimonadaceae bacterium]